jgi:hypothetical protein
MSQRIAGIIQVQVDGQIYNAKGNFSYNPGSPKRDAVVGSDRVHGFTEKPQVAYIEGEFTDTGDLDLIELTLIENATVTIALANGKTFALHGAYYAAEGTANTEEGNIGVRFEGEGDEI